MTAPVTVKIEGLAELQRKLMALGGTITEDGANLMTRDGAKHILKIAKKNVPVDTGNLRDSLVVRKFEDAKRDGRASYWVCHTRGRGAKHDGWYAHLVEYGPKTGPYEIVPKRKKALAFDWKGHGSRRATDRWRTVLSVVGGGPKAEPKTWTPKPYMRKSFDEGTNGALLVMRESLRQWFEKATRRLAASSQIVWLGH